MRRGFTILELSLAAAIGGLIVLASLGVFTALDRTDRTLKAKFDETSQMTRLHAVMRRTFVNLAMSPKPRPTTRPQSSSASKPPTTDGSNDPGSTSNVVIEQPRPEQPLEPPRVILGEDRRISATTMVRTPVVGDATHGELSIRPQRLEVVLGRPPVPIPKTREAGVFPEANAGQAEVSDGEELLGTKLFRGIFELQPVLAGTVGPGGGPARSMLTWCLWWRPMPPGSSAEQSAEGSVREFDLLPPTLIASDLTFLRWQFYDDRERKTEFSTAYLNDLPAYIEMEVQTASGMWAHWVFEVDFIMSTEESSGESGGPSTGGGTTGTFKGAKPAGGGSSRSSTKGGAS